MNLMYTVNCAVFFASEDTFNTDFFTDDAGESQQDSTNTKQVCNCQQLLVSLSELGTLFAELEINDFFFLKCISMLHLHTNKHHSSIHWSSVYVEVVLTHTHTHAHTHTVQLGFWDPRSDDDHLVVTSLDFQEELLAVGLHGGVALIFNLSSQTSVVDMKVCVSFLQFDLPLRY